MAEARIAVADAGGEDFFGPLVVAACWADARGETALTGARLVAAPGAPARKLVGLARRVRAVCPNEVVVVGPSRLNHLVRKLEGYEAVRAWAHEKCLEGLLRAYPDVAEVVSAGLPDKGSGRLGGEVPLVRPSDARRDRLHEAAEALAQGEFHRRLARLAEEAGRELPPGTRGVLPIARELYSKGGLGIMAKYAKLHFDVARQLG